MDLSLFAVEANDAPAIWFLNTLTTIHATAGQTGGAFGLCEQIAPPGPGSPYHVHRAEDEAFYVLEGELEFISEDRRFTAGPGGFVFLPRNVPHGFRILGPNPARFLILMTPGGFEGFMVEAGAPAEARQLPEPAAPDMDRLMAAAARRQLEILGPLPD